VIKLRAHNTINSLRVAYFCCCFCGEQRFS